MFKEVVIQLPHKEERLQKVIAQSGLTSRRKAEELIRQGRVKVNGKTVTTLGTKVSRRDEIEVDHIPIEKEKFVYYLLYKPRGVISSVKDDKDRTDITDLMKDVNKRIFPVGRLDYNTSGALIVTNDGEFAHLLMHPRYEMEKVYVAKVRGIPDEKTLSQIKRGVRDERDLLKAIKYKVLSTDRNKNTMILQIHLHEGKNRHIHRMMEKIGHPVLKLKRERFSFLTLDGLQPGTYRPLKKHEIDRLITIALENVEQ